MSIYDRPTQAELIDAARMHLETSVIPAVKGDAKLYFQTLVAINILKIAARQTVYEWAHLRAAWDGLNTLEGVTPSLPSDAQDAAAAFDQRQAVLCAAIRSGAYDDKMDDLVTYLMAVTRSQLEVANPKFLEAIDAEV